MTGNGMTLRKRRPSLSSIAENDSTDRPEKRAKIEEDDDDDEYNDVGDSKKRITVAPKRGRRKAGKLALIMTMPVDVFCVIASHLEPSDLLRMSRATKTLRSFLLSKTSKSVWSAAEAALGLPECPSDLSNPKYASLLFETFCTECFRPRQKDADFVTRKRLCKSCRSIMISHSYALMNRVGTHYDALRAVTPGTSSPDVVKRFPPGKQWIRGAPMCNFADHHFPSDVFNSMVDEFKALGDDEDIRESYLEEKMQRLRERCKHAIEVEKWVVNKIIQKEDSNSVARDQRRETIRKRLTELGYSEEDLSTAIDPRGWKWSELVNKPKELTERDWKRILPQLKATIDLRREKRASIAEEKLAKQLKEAQSARRKKLCNIVLQLIDSKEGNHYLFPYDEFFKLPIVIEVLEGGGTASDISDADTQAIRDKVLEVGAANKELSVQKWGRAMISSLSSSGLMEAIESPTTEDCLRVLDQNYAFLLVPRWGSETPCTMSDLLRFQSENAKDLYMYEYTTKSTAAPEPKPNELLVNIGRALAKDMNLEPFSMSELELFRDVFTCKRCDWSRNGIRQFSWFTLVSHFYNKLTSYGLRRTKHILDDTTLGELADCDPTLKVLQKKCFAPKQSTFENANLE